VSVESDRQRDTRKNQLIDGLHGNSVGERNDDATIVWLKAGLRFQQLTYLTVCIDSYNRIAVWACEAACLGSRMFKHAFPDLPPLGEILLLDVEFTRRIRRGKTDEKI
jgi:hypothetical protein